MASQVRNVSKNEFGFEFLTNGFEFFHFFLEKAVTSAVLSSVKWFVILPLDDARDDNTCFTN